MQWHQHLLQVHSSVSELAERAPLRRLRIGHAGRPAREQCTDPKEAAEEPKPDLAEPRPAPISLTGAQKTSAEMVVDDSYSQTKH